MIIYTKAVTAADLHGILSLQKSNLSRSLDAQEVEKEGFVTVDHSYEVLKKMNDHEQHVIARSNEQVIGYVLAMTKRSKSDIPVLLPMFEMFEKIQYRKKFISEYNYIVVGQVCVDKNFRGQGIFDNCYHAYRKFYSKEYDFAITEIASTNMRSRNAHKRIGFKEVYSYVSPDNIEWIVVIWDWC